MPPERPTAVAWVALTLLAGSLARCGSSSCDGFGCAAPIGVRAAFPEAGAGTYTVTFCKGDACVATEFALPDQTSVSLEEQGMSLHMVLAPSTSGELSVAVSVLDASSFPEAEAVTLTVEGPGGEALMQGAATARYETRSRGSGDCGACRWFSVDMSQ